jgi:glutaredoxin-related protein
MFTHDPDSKQLSEAKEKYNWPTVPIIWKGDEFIGGFTDLQRLLEDGETEEEKDHQE